MGLEEYIPGTLLLLIFLYFYVQAVVIMTMAVYFFPDTFLKIVTITFTALILSEILNVYTEVKILFKLNKNT